MLEPDQKITVVDDEKASIVSSNPMPYGYLVEQATVVDFTGISPSEGYWLVKDVSFDCVAFELCPCHMLVDAPASHLGQPDHEDQETVIDLPNESLHGLWDSYVDFLHAFDHWIQTGNLLTSLQAEI